MTVTPLTTAQQSAVDALVQSRRIERVPVDALRAQAFLGQATDALEELAVLTKASIRYNVAYDACHDVGEALLATYGYRTSNGAGQHEALGRFLRAVVIEPPGDSAARRFDQLRRSRNQQRYGAAPVGAADAELAAVAAHDLLQSARDLGITD
ncbi:hypothetical protein [Demequina sp. SO4-18]|uniref:hypothetical protein n=1 Tax=Demequina sp. SO4-18 TaxID=3401026 RepID=UPI003B5CC395